MFRYAVRGRKPRPEIWRCGSVVARRRREVLGIVERMRLAWYDRFHSGHLWLMSRDDGRFDVAVAVQHVTKHVLQARKRLLAGDVIRALDLLLGDQRERLAHRFRGVVERRLDRDLGVMQAVGIE